MTDLNEIALKYKSDKSAGGHNYTELYAKYFKDMREKPINLMEIGIGDHGGDSLRIWLEYFERAKIIGLDWNHSFVERANSIHTDIKAYQFDQGGDYNEIERILKINYPEGLDIIIDDGSHDNNHIMHSFKSFWPMLRDGGIYVIEDTYSSWLSPENSATLSLIKEVVPRINDHVSGYTNEERYMSIHIYREIIFILKGLPVTK